jgi:hypothetical protein
VAVGGKEAPSLREGRFTKGDLIAPTWRLQSILAMLVGAKILGVTFSPFQFCVDSLPNKDGHAVRADQRFDPLPLVVGQPDFRFLDVQRWPPHSRAHIGVGRFCQSHLSSVSEFQSHNRPLFIKGVIREGKEMSVTDCLRAISDIGKALFITSALTP